MDENTNCMNNYTKEDYDKYFAESDDSLRTCGNCPYFNYTSDGIATCSNQNLN